MLFCLNPASIFFSVAYTESFFAAFVFLGLCFLYQSHAPPFRLRMMGSLMFMLATMTRSNGALMGLFSLDASFRAWKHTAKRRQDFYRAFLELAAVTCVHAFGLFSVLAYGYYQYCRPTSQQDYEYPEWCSWKLPVIYLHVEEHYWNVGFLRYFTMEQIPNFLLAMPVLVWSLLSIYTVGFSSYLRSSTQTNFSVFLVQTLIVTLLSFFMMHVQISTRILMASCPILFWAGAVVTKSSHLFLTYLFLVYVVSYFLLGPGLFCCFYPWT